MKTANRDLHRRASEIRFEAAEYVDADKPIPQALVDRMEEISVELDAADLNKMAASFRDTLGEPMGGQVPPPAVPIARALLRPDTEYDAWRVQQAAITGAEGYREALGRYAASPFRPNLYGHAEQDVLAGGIDEEGGFLLTEDVVAGIFGRKEAPSHVFDAIARRPTNRESVVVRIWRKDPTDPSIYNSNIIPTWVAEIPASAAGQVTPKVGLVKVSVDKARIKVPISRDEISDTDFDILTEIEKSAAGNIRVFLDNAIILGTGVDQPLGLLKDTAITDNAAATNVEGPGAVNQIDNSVTDLGSATDIMDLQAALPEQYEPNAVWVMSRDTRNRIRKLTDFQSRFLWARGFDDTPPTLLGSPVIVSPWMQDGGTDGNIVLVYGDLEEAYQGVIRESIAAQLDPFSKADVEQVELYLRFRFGGRVKNVDAVRLGKV